MIARGKERDIRRVSTVILLRLNNSRGKRRILFTERYICISCLARPAESSLTDAVRSRDRGMGPVGVKVRENRRGPLPLMVRSIAVTGVTKNLPRSPMD